MYKMVMCCSQNYIVERYPQDPHENSGFERPVMAFRLRNALDTSPFLFYRNCHQDTSPFVSTFYIVLKTRPYSFLHFTLFSRHVPIHFYILHCPQVTLPLVT
ncbi:hypothetical protein CEXT_115281 [Caerostris extrusa]|uniref:Uncharacterized protein n=1 Tax=Caerostris extrusa TaxID=172846 RepID=A0AAV4YB79_CAEEX|nr:hypothetical protein CEXT_115281 [Caerostris extrusa]